MSERDLHAEAEDRELLEEHEAHPERFHRVGTDTVKETEDPQAQPPQVG